MFEIISVIPRNNHKISQEEVLHSYYRDGNVLIKTDKGEWYVTIEGTYPSISWEKITNSREFWPRCGTVEEAIEHWEMENVSDKIEIKGAVEIWYDE